MGATKKVLWALVLLATVDLLAGRHLSDGMPLSRGWAKQETKQEAKEATAVAQARSTRPERTVSAAARAEREPGAYSQRP